MFRIYFVRRVCPPQNPIGLLQDLDLFVHVRLCVRPLACNVTTAERGFPLFLFLIYSNIYS